MSNLTDPSDNDEGRAKQQDEVEVEATTAPTIEEAIVKRRLVDRLERPNQRYVDSVVLQRTSKQSVDATHMEIIRQSTGEVHHHAVKLEATPRLAKDQGGDWPIEPPVSIWIHDDGNDAIGKLRDFLGVVRGDLPEETGNYLVARIEGNEIDAATLQRFVAVASTSGKAEALVQAMRP